MNIIEAIENRSLFGPLFKDQDTYAAWKTFCRAVFALPMGEADLALYRECTGRTVPPSQPLKQVYASCGRRGGKSFMSAVIACYLALFFEYDKYLSTGVVATVLILAKDRAQAQVLNGYVTGIITSNPLFAPMVKKELLESLELTNRVRIETVTADLGAVRGRTVVAAIMDECAFWQQDGANPASEILAALEPATAAIPNALLTPRPLAQVDGDRADFLRKKGEFMHRDHKFGRGDIKRKGGETRILVGHAPARETEGGRVEHLGSR